MDRVNLQILFRDISKNDKHAFNELFLRYYARLVQFATHLLTDTQLAEDVVADVFSNLWLKREKLPSVQNGEAYLYTAVKHACFDQVKKQQRSRRVLDLRAEIFEPGSSTIESQEFRLMLENAINALPEQRRLVFVLVKEHGRKCAEVAEILGISVRTVENQLYKAVRTLADAITGYLGYNPQKLPRKQNRLNLFFL